MKILKELLSKYQQSPIIENIFFSDKDDFSSYIKIRKGTIKEREVYVIEPTEIYHQTIGTISCKIILDKKLNLLKSECGCLEHYRKDECAHITILYGLALKKLNIEKFEKEFQGYKQEKLAEEYEMIINKLADDLRNQNNYFNKIHLNVEITHNKDYYLSLHVSYDKEYVVKNISEFIQNTLFHRFYSYGQKLAFVHSYEALDAESKEIYSFLLNIALEDSEKSIRVRRSNLLTILELCQKTGIYYSDNERKTNFYPIVEINKVEIKLNDRALYLDSPKGTKNFICGNNYAYFLGEDKIYYYRFKKRNEAIIFMTLFKTSEEGILLESNSTNFISNLLPVLRNDVNIDDSFFGKFPLPNVSVDSFFEYKNGNIILNEKIIVDEQYMETPYVMQILEGYYKSIESLGFIKNKKGVYALENIDLQYYFITSDLSILKNYGEIYFDSSIKKISVKKSSKVQVFISFNVGLLDFKLDSNKLSLEEVQAMLGAYREKKKFVKLKNDVILEIKDEDVKELDCFLEDFNISLEDLNKDIQKPMSYILKLVGTPNDDMIVNDEKVIEMINGIQNYKESLNLPKELFLNKLRPYQMDAYKWLSVLASYGFGGILADDMGLGKTLEILSFVESDDVSAPTLIACPMSLIFNWENECKKWNLDIPTIVILGGAQEREDIIKKIDFNKKSIYITSYDSLRRDIEFYDGTFRFVIADEAQNIKNQNALKSTAIKKLKSQINFALTGTPIENGLADLWNIFDYLMPGYLSSYNQFRNRYESLILHDDDEALLLLKKRVQPFILRRTKKDVLKDLPPKTEEIYYCKMDDAQKKIYDAYTEQLKADIKENGNQTLALITRLRQICITPQLIYEEEFASSKIALCLELISRAISGGHRILLFSQFASVFDIIEKSLKELDINYFVLNGSTKAQRRLELVDEFNHNQDIKVFMISLKAGGTGLNLTGADMVIHLDPWWNVSAENQATDRAHRIGQTKNVHVLKLVCKDTIEEKVLLLQRMKQELASSIVSDNESKNIKLTKKDILEMLD